MTGHPKRPRDPNQLAKSIIDIATGVLYGALKKFIPELRATR